MKELMNATLFPQDRTRGISYKQDKLFRKFISDTNLCPLDWHLPPRTWTFRSEMHLVAKPQGVDHTAALMTYCCPPPC
eukprot:666262-Pelagomonas_calceolata.AAC.1